MDFTLMQCQLIFGGQQNVALWTLVQLVNGGGGLAFCCSRYQLTSVGHDYGLGLRDDTGGVHVGHHGGRVAMPQNHITTHRESQVYGIDVLLKYGLNGCFELTLRATVHVHDIAGNHIQGQWSGGQHGRDLRDTVTRYRCRNRGH